jgi:hypothetical protein
MIKKVIVILSITLSISYTDAGNSISNVSHESIIPDPFVCKAKGPPSCRGEFQEAIWLSHAHCVKELLKCDSIRKGLNNSSYEGLYEKYTITPLHYALWYARAEIVSILLAEGANKDHIDETGWDSFHFAAFSVIESHKKVELLLSTGISCTRKTKNHTTAVDIAISWGNRDSARLLIAHGAISENPLYHDAIKALKTQVKS